MVESEDNIFNQGLPDHRSSRGYFPEDHAYPGTITETPLERVRREQTEPHADGRLRNHRWIIDGQNGPTSMGVCKHCGESKQFRNSLQENIRISRKPR